MSDTFAERLPLSRHEIDRDYLTRERPDVFDELWADPATRVLPLWKGQVLLATPTSLSLRPVDQVPDAQLLLYLGRSTSTTSLEPTGTPIVAAVLSDSAAADLEGSWGALRAIGPLLSDRDAGLCTEAIGLANWHESHAFSPRTGQPTVSEKGGWVRRDPSSNTEVFPRTDPAVIVGVVDEQDRLLLGSNALWPEQQYSLLAGFVEPGESLEGAVMREILEESGVHVYNPVYLGSQPWPFPASLMLGYLASVDPRFSNELTPDGTEIRDLRWFSRQELAASVGQGGSVRLPGRASIARAIIEEWFGSTIDDG